MEKIDVAIIGAGVVGLALGREIANKEKNVFIFEQYRSFGQETSSRNSEVIHSGIYYPESTIKTKTCIEGNRMLYDICLKNTIPYKRTGKLIVSVTSPAIASWNAVWSILGSPFNEQKPSGFYHITNLSQILLKNLSNCKR